jgi:hypothetical protein
MSDHTDAHASVCRRPLVLLAVGGAAPVPKAGICRLNSTFGSPFSSNAAASLRFSFSHRSTTRLARGGQPLRVARRLRASHWLKSP